MNTPAYIDLSSGATYPIDKPRWQSCSGNPLAITDLPGLAREDIDTTQRSLWRYAAALPVVVRNPVTLGEGCTPLVARPWMGNEVLFKLEWFSPSGSFKDRGASVMISILRQQGVTRILEDSSGNGGAAMAIYAAAAGMDIKILTPASTSMAKTVQMRACGARVELVPGSRQDAAEEAVRQAEEIFYASHNWQAHFLQGTKTLAYELWEDLGFQEPDNIIIPCGAGSNVLGCDIGFGELKRRGEIRRLPRLFAVQPRNCAPLHAGFVAGAGEFVAIDPQPTIAEGASISRPVRSGEVLAAVRRSGGAVIAVAEGAIASAVTELGALGLYAEPTAATGAAALTSLLREGTIRPEERTIVLLTGTGLKATPRIADLIGSA
ncbi:pyridoxal-phosphate dependent enzyme [Methylorubrum rhodesianum]|uniref:pyridoxal-phosphate dependent enzyme n=1 Tax=Methylorubrum rhodesianum TaxID=29427 RepID=UPI003D03B3A2